MTELADHSSQYILRSGSADVDPTARTDWQYTGVRVIEPHGSPVTVTPRGQELLVLPLSGGCTVDVAIGDATTSHTLQGRPDPYSGPSDALYATSGASVTITGDGRYAVATAVAPPGATGVHLIAADEVDIMARGAAQMSRLVRGYCMPGAFEGSSALLVCEVITPGGNWSGYPAHKHDEHTDTERELEEIYLYDFTPGPGGEPGFGYHQTTTAADDRPIDILTEVRSGDVVLVPYGWHGPCAAAPGHDMYYLNVMAGPVTDGQWLITDHPDHTWVRRLWPTLEVDPRVRKGLR